MGLRLWQGGAVYLNPENDVGYGLANSVGAASYVDGAVAKVGRAAPYMRFQRYFLRQIIGLDGSATEQSDEGSRNEVLESTQNQISGHVDRDRVDRHARKIRRRRRLRRQCLCARSNDRLPELRLQHDGRLRLRRRLLGLYARSRGRVEAELVDGARRRVPALHRSQRRGHRARAISAIHGRRRIRSALRAFRPAGRDQVSGLWRQWLSEQGRRRDPLRVSSPANFRRNVDSVRKRSVKTGGGINVKQQLMPESRLLSARQHGGWPLRDGRLHRHRPQRRLRSRRRRRPRGAATTTRSALAPRSAV